MKSKLNQIVTINSLKFDRSISRSWSAELLDQNNSYLKLVGKFEKEVVHPDLGIIRPGTLSYEFFWFNEWFNIFQFHEPNGEFRNFYCNLSLPPEFHKNFINYVDLDIDILIRKDFSFEILDEDEFLYNSEKYNYPEEINIRIRESINKISELLAQRRFPFDLFVDKP